MSDAHRRFVARTLGHALARGWPDPARMLAFAEASVGYRFEMLSVLVTAALETFALHRPTPAEASVWVDRAPSFRALHGFELDEIDEFDREAIALGIHLAGFLPRARMSPALRWPVPAIVHERGLAEFLTVRERDLELYAGLHHREARVPEGPFRNYRYLWRKKRASSGLRLIEAPKYELKKIQRHIAGHILSRVPAHDAAHGFLRGRSILTHARVHTAQRVVLRLDIQDFFPSIGLARVIALFRGAGYPEHIARMLGGLTTNRVPRAVLAACDEPMTHEMKGRYLRPHLPQGAPSSPAIANLCAFRLDLRLSGLARRFGARYTRYADDLIFSGDGDFERVIPRFVTFASAIVADEGWVIRGQKTRVMKASVRQRVTGLVVNERPNTARRRYEELKAILHNAARHGPASQNRKGIADFRAHLLGQIGFVAMSNPERGARLRAACARIDWQAAAPD